MYSSHKSVVANDDVMEEEEDGDGDGGVLIIFLIAIVAGMGLTSLSVIYDDKAGRRSVAVRAAVVMNIVVRTTVMVMTGLLETCPVRSFRQISHSTPMLY